MRLPLLLFLAAFAINRAFAADPTVAVAPADAGQAVRIAVPYTSPGKGYVSLGLFNKAGTLVRNLLCAQYVEQGPRAAIWDGTSDLGLPVPAGDYTVKAEFFAEPPSVTLLTKVGKSGNPTWRTADGKGDWGGNLGPGTGICSNSTAVISAWVCVEDPQITGIQQMDGDGNIQMRYSSFYPWDCRWAAAMDDKELYLGILKDRKELQIAEYNLGNPRGRILMTLPTAMGPQGQSLTAMAITPMRIFASVAANGELFVIERGSGRVLNTLKLPGVNGLAISSVRPFGDDGSAPSNDSLLAVVGKQVVRFTLDGANDGVVVREGVLKDPTALCVGSDGNIYVGDLGGAGTKQIHVFDQSGRQIRTIGKLGGANPNGRYDGQNGFGDNFWMCMSPDGKSLFINDRPTGFARTSRWSLTGVLQKEWFGGSNDNSAPPINPARPDEVVKISGQYYSPEMRAWQIDAAKKTWYPSWHYAAPFTDSWHDDVINGGQTGIPWLSKDAGFPGTNPVFGYSGDGGLRTYKGHNYMLSDTGVIFIYGPDAAPKPVAMVGTHHCEKQGNVVQLFGNSGPNNWLTWTDRNGDGKPQIDEITVVKDPPALEGGAQWIKCFFDDNLNINVMRWTGPDYENAGAVSVCTVPLVEMLPNGVPVYDWNKAVLNPKLLKPDMNGATGKVTNASIDNVLIDGGDSWYGLLQAGGDHAKISGIDGDGWWASRNWRKKIVRFDKKTGACLWAAGRRAPWVAQPGEMYNPINIAGVAGGAVFAGDAMGVAWVWDQEGLYLGRLYNGPDDKKADANSIYCEMMGATVVAVGDKIRIYANDACTSVHEVHLPERLPLAVAPVAVTDAQAAAAKPWDPDGGAPLEKPVYRVQSLVLHPAAKPMTIDGVIDADEGWQGLSDGTKVDTTQVWLDGQRVATVRALYDDTNLYLSYEVSAANGPVNSGTELPICPFVSGAYIDASFAPDWSQPQRADAREGDVRVIVAQITGQGDPKPFESGYWEKKKGGVGSQTITSPAASMHMDQIKEIPGLKQAWKITGHDGPQVLYTAEISIPLSELGLDHAKGRSIGFDTSIGIANDAGNGRARAAHWGGLSEAAVVDRPGSSKLLPENWGTLIFLEK